MFEENVCLKLAIYEIKYLLILCEFDICVVITIVQCANYNRPLVNDNRPYCNDNRPV